MCRRQVAELQKALQTATTRMLSSETSQARRLPQLSSRPLLGVGPVHAQPSHRQAMLGSGGSLFEGLSVGGKPNAGV